MTGGRVSPPPSAVFLPEGVPHRRARFSLRRRPPAFNDAFDARALFYDCFRHHDGRRALLVGPPPVNLDYGAIEFTANGTRLARRFHSSLSVTVTELLDVPEGTGDISVSFRDVRVTLPIRSSRCADFAGTRIVFTVNKNNDLDWIREWALWHVRHHGADAVVLTDNGSTAYSPQAIADTLASVPGIGNFAVECWPVKFGPIDPAVFNNPYWSRFFQISTMSMTLRRYGMLASGLLNCDIDELALTQSGRSMFDVARVSPGGLVVFRGLWVEAVPEAGSPPRPPHRAYRQVLADPRAALSPQRKWALDPSRPWVERLSVHPYWHWIEGRDRKAKSMPDDAAYFHFRGINTNWKEARTTPPANAVRRDPTLDRAFGELER